MGMFDYGEKFDPTVSPWERASQTAEQARQGLMREVVDPAIESATGYASPQMQLKRMAAETDLSDMNSVRNTFNAIMEKSPEAAARWIKSVEPMLKEEQTAASLTTRQKDVRDIAQFELGCDINDPNCYKEASKLWQEGKRSTPSEKGAAEALKDDAKLYGENTKSILQAGQSAKVKLAKVDQSLKALESGSIYTGPGAGAVNFAHQIGAVFGVDASQVPAANAGVFVANAMADVMTWISQTKGAISEKEMAAFIAASPNLSQTREGNRLLLTTLKTLYQHGEKLAAERAKWSMEDKKEFYKQNPYGHYVPSPFRWQMHLEEWNKQNPLDLPTAGEMDSAMGTGSGDVKGKTVKKGRFTVTED